MDKFSGERPQPDTPYKRWFNKPIGEREDLSWPTSEVPEEYRRLIYDRVRDRFLGLGFDEGALPSFEQVLSTEEGESGWRNRNIFERWMRFDQKGIKVGQKLKINKWLRRVVNTIGLKDIWDTIAYNQSELSRSKFFVKICETTWQVKGIYPSGTVLLEGLNGEHAGKVLIADLFGTAIKFIDESKVPNAPVVQSPRRGRKPASKSETTMIKTQGELESKKNKVEWQRGEGFNYQKYVDLMRAEGIKPLTTEELGQVHPVSGSGATAGELWEHIFREGIFPGEAIVMSAGSIENKLKQAPSRNGFDFDPYFRHKLHRVFVIDRIEAGGILVFKQTFDRFHPPRENVSDDHNPLLYVQYFKKKVI